MDGTPVSSTCSWAAVRLSASSYRKLVKTVGTLMTKRNIAKVGIPPTRLLHITPRGFITNGPGRVEEDVVMINRYSERRSVHYQTISSTFKVTNLRPPMRGLRMPNDCISFVHAKRLCSQACLLTSKRDLILIGVPKLIGRGRYSVKVR